MYILKRYIFFLRYIGKTNTGIYLKKSKKNKGIN